MLNSTETEVGVTVNPMTSSLSPMARAFLLTGGICLLTMIVGCIYAVLYHTQMSLSSRRKIERLRSNRVSGMNGGAGGGTSERAGANKGKRSAHISIFGVVNQNRTKRYGKH